LASSPLVISRFSSKTLLLNFAASRSAGHDQLDLAELAVISDDEFRQRFRRTPLWRSHPAGMRRNAQVVLKNLAD